MKDHKVKVDKVRSGKSGGNPGDDKKASTPSDEYKDSGYILTRSNYGLN